MNVPAEQMRAQVAFERGFCCHHPALGFTCPHGVQQVCFGERSRIVAGRRH